MNTKPIPFKEFAIAGPPQASHVRYKFICPNCLKLANMVRQEGRINEGEKEQWGCENCLGN
jgi:hypothetical protein